jgi:glycosyltransferase involved in cell wall biosynthesis
VSRAAATRHRILVVTDEPLAERLAGPGIRALSIATELGTEHDVRLVSTQACRLSRPGLDCREVPYRRLRAEVDWAEVVVLQGYVLQNAPWLADSGTVLVVDLYDPLHLEQLAMGDSSAAGERAANVAATVRVLDTQVMCGDFFLCASEQQRHFWLGHLAALGRLNVTNYDADPTARSLVAVCPFGLPAEPPVRTGPALKGVVPGIGPDDKVVLWAGGVYNWFDPVSLVRAVDIVRRSRPEVRLYFLGMSHPAPQVPRMRVATETRALAESLGLVGTHVFFNSGWVPYERRQDFLLEADAGVSTHVEHLETIYSFRTRIMDYLWAGLPIVATGGDSLSDLVEREGLGVTVPERDPVAIAAALEKVLGDEEFAAACRDRIAAVAPRFTWRESLAPLLDFCRDPRQAPDRRAGTAPTGRSPLGPVETGYRPSVRGDLRLIGEYYRHGGVREVLRRVGGRVRGRVTGRVRGRVRKAR